MAIAIAIYNSNRNSNGNRNNNSNTLSNSNSNSNKLIIVLAIEDEWKISYDELIRLWTVGALLIGLGAIPAGWLSDKWSRSGMMLIMFIGLGFSSIICGFSENKTILFIGLTLLGLSCSIYHPVAISWVVNLSNKTGRALGINGIFGGIGIGFGTLFAGYLIGKPHSSYQD